MTTPTQTRQPQALDDLAYWLAIRHQDAQQQIANSTAAGLALLWGVLQFSRLDESTPGWLHGVTLQVEQKFRESEDAAFDFVQGTKWAIEPLSKPLRKIDTVFPTKDFQLAMRATGPATVKRGTQAAFAPPERDSERLFSGFPPEVQQANLDRLADDLLGRGKLNSTGAGVKFALNGGRGEVQQLVISDARERIRNRQTIGWARFTEDSQNGPCYFCALLASQGATYLDATSFDRSNNKIRDFGAPKGEGQELVADLLRRLDERADRLNLPSQSRSRRAFLGDGLAKVHDHCRCSLRPVYREEDSMDDRASFFLKQWEEMDSTGLSWKDQIKEFRRVYKRPPPYRDNPPVSLAAVRRNRELVAQELGVSSPHVRWWDRQIKALEAAS